MSETMQFFNALKGFSKPELVVIFAMMASSTRNLVKFSFDLDLNDFMEAIILANDLKHVAHDPDIKKMASDAVTFLITHHEL